MNKPDNPPTNTPVNTLSKVRLMNEPIGIPKIFVFGLSNMSGLTLINAQ